MAAAPDSLPVLHIANHRALELVNTVNGRPDWSTDYIATPLAALDWANHVELFGAATHRKGGREGFDRLIDLRESLYRIFSTTAQGKPPSRRDLHYLFEVAHSGLRVPRWHLADGRLVPLWPDASLLHATFVIADEAVELVRSGDLRRVRACEGCGWMFLDTSKAGARRWCSMDICGAREKMRRYRART
jgi:predicted RNA-binding Zn ribbon-like protein